MISALALAALISVSDAPRVEIVAPPEPAFCEFNRNQARPCYVMGVTIDNGEGVGLSVYDPTNERTITVLGVDPKAGSFAILGILMHEQNQIVPVNYGVCQKRGSVVECQAFLEASRQVYSLRVQLSQ